MFGEKKTDHHSQRRRMGKAREPTVTKLLGCG
jgi:hypothetical protein